LTILTADVNCLDKMSDNMLTDYDAINIVIVSQHIIRHLVKTIYVCYQYCLAEVNCLDKMSDNMLTDYKYKK